MRSEIERLQSLLSRLEKLDDLAKAEILANLAPILNPKEESKEPQKKIDDAPEKHFQAALHHASWWAGHQGKYSKTGNHQDLAEANKHLFLSKQHLLKAHEESGHDKEGKDVGALIEGGGINPAHHHVWAGTSQFGHKLLDVVHAAKKDETKSHVGGWKISDFGPDAVLTQRKTKATELSDPGSHPLDEKISKARSSDYEVEVESPLKMARERLKTQEA